MNNRHFMVTEFKTLRCVMVRNRRFLLLKLKNPVFIVGQTKFYCKSLHLTEVLLIK